MYRCKKIKAFIFNVKDITNCKNSYGIKPKIMIITKYMITFCKCNVKLHYLHFLKTTEELFLKGFYF